MEGGCTQQTLFILCALVRRTGTLFAIVFALTSVYLQFRNHSPFPKGPKYPIIEYMWFLHVLGIGVVVWVDTGYILDLYRTPSIWVLGPLGFDWKLKLWVVLDCPGLFSGMLFHVFCFWAVIVLAYSSRSTYLISLPGPYLLNSRASIHDQSSTIQTLGPQSGLLLRNLNEVTIIQKPYSLVYPYYSKLN